MKKEKKTNKKYALYTLIGFVLFAAVYSIASEGSKTPEEKRKEQIEKQFSPITGEHNNLTETIKRELSDPGSYKNLETNYSDIDTAIIVNQQYTFTNTFGGKDKGFVKAEIDLSGNVKRIIDKR